MAQAARQESLRIKLLLVSLVLLIVGGTFALLAVEATQTDWSIPNTAVTDDITLLIGYALKDYTVSAQVNAVGLVRVVITNLDAGITLYNNFVSNQVMTISPLSNPIPGRIQIQLTPFSGATAVFSASIQHQSTAYPLLIPGIIFAVAGAVVILTRVYKVRFVTSIPTSTRV